jgi:hypothetical protein
MDMNCKLENLHLLSDGDLKVCLRSKRETYDRLWAATLSTVEETRPRQFVPYLPPQTVQENQELVYKFMTYR